MGQEPKRQLESQTEERMTPLHVAAAHGNKAIVDSILQAPFPVDIDKTCDGGWTALHLACGTQVLPPGGSALDLGPRYLAAVRALVSADANVNMKASLSRTALHIAAEMGHVKICTKPDWCQQ